MVASFFLLSREAESPSVSSEETQDQQEASDPFHDIPAAGLGEKVPSEAVPVHRRARRVLQFPQLDRNPGQDLVSEQESQSQTTTGGGTRETKNGS